MKLYREFIIVGCELYSSDDVILGRLRGYELKSFLQVQFD